MRWSHFFYCHNNQSGGVAYAKTLIQRVQCRGNVFTYFYHSILDGEELG